MIPKDSSGLQYTWMPTFREERELHPVLAGDLCIHLEPGECMYTYANMQSPILLL